MYNYSVFASSDEQRAQFASFFITHREQFSKELLLRDAIMYILTYIDQSTIMFTYNEKEELIGAVNCWPVGDDKNTYDEQGSTILISSAVLMQSERSTRVFMHGFRDMINGLIHMHPMIHTVRFTARADNSYLNKLYSKCATYTETIEGDHGSEHVYEVAYEQLKGFLNVLKPK